MINVYSFGVILQIPLNWGIDQFRSEDKMVQDDVVAKTSNVALKALKALGAVFVIVFTSPVYALGALFKFFSMHSKEAPKEASTADQVAKDALKESTSSSNNSSDSSVSGSPSVVVEQRFLHKTEDFKELITKLEDIYIRAGFTIAEIETMVTLFLVDEKCRDELFVVLKSFELDIKDTSTFKSERANVKISAEEMKDFLVKHFGIAGYIYRNNLQYEFNIKICAENLAPVAALEKLLQSDLGQKDLELINKLETAGVLSSERKYFFENGELYFNCWNYEGPVSISDFLKNTADGYGRSAGLIFNRYVSDYTQEIFDAVVKG